MRSDVDAAPDASDAGDALDVGTDRVTLVDGSVDRSLDGDADGSEPPALDADPDARTVDARDGVTRDGEDAQDSGGGGDGCSIVTCGLVGITISPLSVSLVEGSTTWMVATGIYANQSTSDLTTEVTWTTSNPSAAAVGNVFRAQGLVAALDAGETIITADLAGLVGAAHVVVSPADPVSFEILEVSPKQARGIARPLTALLTFRNGVTKDVTSTATWSSTNPSVASVGADGVVTAVMPGVATISATTGSKSAALSTTVTSATPNAIDVWLLNRTLPVGFVEELTAAAEFDDGTTEDVTKQVTWTSSDVARAVVGIQGRVTTLSSGPVTITASLGALSGSVPIDVNSATLKDITVRTLGDWQLVIGLLRGVEAFGEYSDGVTRYFSKSASWSSLDTKVATVNGQMIRGEGPGRTRIAASYGGLVGEADIEVRVDELLRIELSLVPSTLEVGEWNYVAATGYYASTQDNLGRQVAWTTQDPAVAFITNIPGSTTRGRVTGFGPGTTTITAYYAGRSASTVVMVKPPAGDAGTD